MSNEISNNLLLDFSVTSNKQILRSDISISPKYSSIVINGSSESNTRSRTSIVKLSPVDIEALLWSHLKPTRSKKIPAGEKLPVTLTRNHIRKGNDDNLVSKLLVEDYSDDKKYVPPKVLFSSVSKSF